MSAFSVRTATAGDAMEVAKVHVRSWQAAYRGLVPDSYLDALRPEDRAARYTFGAAGGEGPTTAERFYRADGWTADGARRTAKVWGVTAAEVRYRRELR
jgi:hypothetical protein